MYEFVLSERLEVDGQEKGNSPVVKEVARCYGDADGVAMFLRSVADRLAPPPPATHYRGSFPAPQQLDERRTVDLRPDLS